jgi:hypothetical protein
LKKASAARDLSACDRGPALKRWAIVCSVSQNARIATAPDLWNNQTP